MGKKTLTSISPNANNSEMSKLVHVWKQRINRLPENKRTSLLTGGTITHIQRKKKPVIWSIPNPLQSGQGLETWRNCSFTSLSLVCQIAHRILRTRRAGSRNHPNFLPKKAHVKTCLVFEGSSVGRTNCSLLSQLRIINVTQSDCAQVKLRPSYAIILFSHWDTMTVLHLK